MSTLFRLFGSLLKLAWDWFCVLVMFVGATTWVMMKFIARHAALAVFIVIVFVLASLKKAR